MDFQQSNNALVGSAFDAMRPSLGAFEMREMIRKYGDSWWDEGVLGHLFEDQRRNVPGSDAADDVERIGSLDVLLMLRLVDQAWKDVFLPVMDRRSKTWAHELIDTRNAWAHSTGEGLSDSDTERAFDTMARFIDPIDPDVASLIRGRYKDSREPVIAVAEEGQASQAPGGIAEPVPVHDTGDGRLRPWRSVVAPQDDVARGHFKTAEFALDLATVAKGGARLEYQDPREFFSRTYITDGMESLLETALRRVSATNGDDGDPVVELKTAFGGGKTHSMLAVYHLMRMSAHARDLPGVADVMDRAGVPSLPDKVYVATLVGTDLDPSSFKNPPFLSGKVNTLWGEMAYQLCLQRGDPAPYSIIRSADSKSVAPGTEKLVQLFDAIGPCVILIDEFVAYARNLYGADSRNLPAGTFGNVLSFMQQLTEAVKRTKNCMLIASLPESDTELGDESGRLALERVERVFGRIHSIWRSATNEEGFEIVKRRLFGSYDESLAEPVVDAFMTYYRTDPDKFPVECRDPAYRERMLRCYPIHPQVFDRLYEDWSTLESFQRTRGVLRLMATVIHQLWEANDADPLIMPGSIDFSDARISEEVFQYLDPAWNAVVDTDVDGDGSIPAAIDKESGRFSRPRAARRMARAIFLGSAPTSRGEGLRGLDSSDVRLGATIPGTNVTVYDDALTKMRDELSYLYTTGNRWWYDIHPTLDKMARDRASRVEGADVRARIAAIIRETERASSSGFGNVYPCPRDGSEVPDEPVCSLVIIPSDRTQGSDHERSDALAYAADVLSSRGESLRVNRNMLLFVAMDESERKDVTDAVSRAIAWGSIDSDADALELTSHARSEACRKLDVASSHARRLVLGAYRHLICPSQSMDDLSSICWDVISISGSESISGRAFDKAARDEIIVRTYSPFLLDHDINDVLLGDDDSIAVCELWADYCQYCYLRRFASVDVLRQAIEEGAGGRDYFAYADGFDGERYLGLKLGERPVVDMHCGLVVRREKALEQLAFDGQGEETSGAVPTHKPDEDDGRDVGPTDAPTGVTPSAPEMREVQIEAHLDRLTAGSQVGGIVEEILQRLYDIPGCDAELTFEAYVNVPDGIDDVTLRVIRENANALGITLRTK